MFWKRLLYYFDITSLFRKRKGDKNINLSLMHGMNRFTILAFIICLIVLAIKFCSKIILIVILNLLA